MKIKTWQVAVVVVLMIFFVDHFSRVKAQTVNNGQMPTIGQDVFIPTPSTRFTETDCTTVYSERVCNIEDTKTTNHWIVVYGSSGVGISRND